MQGGLHGWMVNLENCNKDLDVAFLQYFMSRFMVHVTGLSNYVENKSLDSLC